MKLSLRRSILLPLAALTVLGAGCANDDQPQYDASSQGRYVAVPMNGDAPQSTTLSDAPPAGAAPLGPLAHGGDAIAQGGGTLGGSNSALDQSGGLAAKGDPLTADADGNRSTGWYWLRGTVENGRVSVSLNGVPCGEYTEFTNREVTRYVNPGQNRIAFTSLPDSPLRPMSAHLVVYMRARSADVHQTVPVADFDSENAAQPGQDFTARAPSAKAVFHPAPAPQPTTLSFFAH